MVTFARFTDEERQIVIAIADRAVGFGIYEDILTADMDISATYVHCPLRLLDLLSAARFDFTHDMGGIRRHLNRQTGELEGFFLPRFAQPD